MTEETPKTGGSNTPAQEIMATLASLTETMKDMAAQLDGVRLELRKANQLNVEKMRFNQFMDTMRSEWVKLAKRLAKEAANATKGEKTGSDGK